MDHLIPPHSGALVDLMAPPQRAEELRVLARDLPSWPLTPRQLCDLEMLLHGAFSPLDGFMGREAAESVCRDLRLPDGTLWPIPVTLDVEPAVAEAASRHAALVLRDPEGLPLAVLQVEEAFAHDRAAEAEAVYGTLDRHHPGVAHLLDRTNNVAVGGRVEGLRTPPHYDFVALRETPQELRDDFSRRGWRRVLAFQTRNPMHRAHFELTLRAAAEQRASLLVHPVVGMTKPGDLDHYTRVRCYQALMGRYPAGTAKLSLLPLAMRMAGPREAVLHAIVRKNHGCTHFIVGRDHAGPGADADGKPFYGPYDAQELLRQHEEELGIRMVPFRNMVYVEEQDRYLPEDEATGRVLALSGTELRRRLADGREVPGWFTFPEVSAELRRTHPPRHQQGFTVFLTGLSGAGKSTIARLLQVKFLEIGGRPVTLLDGDIVRTHLSSELGFSKQHRDLNVLRIGFVASEITKNRGIALCAPIAPYGSVRQRVRQAIEPLGGFVLVHVATPLEVCERRDAKGLYAKARAGDIPNFTGISDPYEEPADADVVVDASLLTPEEAAQEILLHLERQGYLGPATGASS
ncbi:MAG TPA: bifunctional sulfate adenylyltransferase/adenylylsulfate kinase [Thermoanaerobaculia bacterium]|nr:bifunctional sulfate adenylyltransferase/adenylylsulfate kinase [Thermoanaerobaculia bacterium]